MKNKTYLTAEELSKRIKYNPRYIRENLKDNVLFEGIHYIRPFGGRKLLFIWEAIAQDLESTSITAGGAIPLRRGGTCHG
jgi:hypothetical protein